MRIYIIFYKKFEKNLIRIIRVHYKKISRQFQAAIVIQVRETIGLVPVGSLSCMPNVRVIG